jgi:SAM-dependent methyltransferase
MSVRYLSDRELQLEFARDADTRRFVNRVSNPFVREKEAALAKRVARCARRENPLVLEVGCGEGSNLWFLESELSAGRLFGVDVSRSKVGFMHRRLPDVKAVVGDAVQLPFRDQQFDIVFCRDLLHHVNWDRDGVVSEGFRVLKRTGVFVVLEGNGGAILNRCYAALYPAERGMKDSTPASLQALCGRHGTVRIQFVECSFLVRALGFILGWRRGLAGAFLSVVYVAASVWERAAAALLPKRRWTYMMIVTNRD